MFGGKTIVLVLLIGAIALTACGSKPERRDPLLDATTPTSKALTLGVILSESTKSAAQAAQQKSQKNPVELFTAMLQRNFKTTVNMERIEEAKALKADLVAVLDVYMELPSKMNVFGDVTVDASAILVAPDGREIDVVRGASASSVAGATMFKADTIRLQEAFDTATQAAKDKLEIALRSSEKLADFSRRGKPSPSQN